MVQSSKIGKYAGELGIMVTDSNEAEICNLLALKDKRLLLIQDDQLDSYCLHRLINYLHLDTYSEVEDWLLLQTLKEDLNEMVMSRERVHVFMDFVRSWRKSDLP